ncbi:MAG: calcium-binding protein, partial [Gemmobacter sp.]
DVIFGAGGNDTLNGGAGDDLILGGPGTVMTGGPGDDIFRLGPGPQHSVITDFEQGHDRLDLGDWGRIHDISALSISPRPYGTLISFGENSLRVSQAGGGPIPVTEWTADDFIF